MLIPLRSDEPTSKPPVITIMLIIANAAVFIYQELSFMGHGRDLAAMYGTIPYEMTHLVDLPPHSHYPIYLSLLTYMFLHGGFVHIIGNMLFLNTFGPNVEDIMGYFKFFIFYILCGLVSVIVYIIPNFNSQIPLVGASGAIAGVMGAHFRTLPGTRIKCLFLIFRVPLPAIVILLPWILLQFANVIMHEQSNVAFIAHIGGFIFGMLFVGKFRNKWLYRYR